MQLELTQFSPNNFVQLRDGAVGGHVKCQARALEEYLHWFSVVAEDVVGQVEQVVTYVSANQLGRMVEQLAHEERCERVLGSKSVCFEGFEVKAC